MLINNASLSAAVGRHTEFEGRFRLLNDIRKSFKNSKLKNSGCSATNSEKKAKSIEVEIEISELYQWSAKKFTEALTQCSFCSDADGVMLVEVAVLFGQKYLYNEYVKTYSR
jgi:hypothetical protein